MAAIKRRGSGIARKTGTLRPQTAAAAAARSHIAAIAISCQHPIVWGAVLRSIKCVSRADFHRTVECRSRCRSARRCKGVRARERLRARPLLGHRRHARRGAVSGGLRRRRVLLCYAQHNTPCNRRWRRLGLRHTPRIGASRGEVTVVIPSSSFSSSSSSCCCCNAGLHWRRKLHRWRWQRILVVQQEQADLVIAALRSQLVRGETFLISNRYQRCSL